MPESPAPVRLIDLGLAPFARTQSAYHAVAEGLTQDSPDTVILCRPASPYLCLGWHDVYDAVLDRAACANAGLPVLRRRLGGGTTYLDSDQPFYQFVFHHSRVPAVSRALYALLLAAPVRALAELGVPATLRDANEIEAQGHRIAGIGGGRVGEAAVVVGNVLCAFDYGVLPRLWNAPWPAFRELATSALAERLTTLRAQGCAASPADFSAALTRVLPACLGRPVAPGVLTPVEEARAARLDSALAAPELLAAHAGPQPPAPMRRLKIAAGVYIHGETIEVALPGAPPARLLVTLRERDGAIEAARVQGPPPLDARAIEAALLGAPIASWRDRVTG